MEFTGEINNKNSVFRQLADAMPLIIWTADPKGTVNFYNRKWYEYTGLPEDQIGDDSWLPVLHPDDRKETMDIWYTAVKTGNPMKVEFRLGDKEKPGEYRWFMGRAQPILNAEGNVIRWVGTCSDINDQKDIQASLRESEERFRFMSDAMPQQVWTANAKGELDYVNQGTVNYFGRSAQTIIGQGWQEVIHPSDLSKTVETWVHSLKTQEPYQVEFRLRDKNGKYKWHLGRATPFINEEKEVKWFGTNTDIEHHKKNEQQKDEFISMASHELKTPVTSLKGYAQVLQYKFKAQNDEESLNLVTRMDTQINKLTKLINDLFDVTKMESQEIKLNRSIFDFKEVVNETLSSIQLTSLRHKIVLETQNSIMYEGDKLRIEQVITNFLSNAIKYSPESDKIIVNYSIERNNIIFSVKDFGIGIERENLTKLFDRFFRVDNSSMKFQGLGLGLYISSRIIKAHQGNFWIESEIGKGSTFYFILPIEKSIQDAVETDNETYYRSESFTLHYNKGKNRLDVDWIGFHNLQSIQKYGMIILDFLTKLKCSKALNDNTNVLGNWAEASEWTGKVLMPKMEKAGLKFLAWVYSPSTFSQLAADKTVGGMIGNITAKFFSTTNEAAQWLENI